MNFDSKFPNLFKPFQIGNVVLKNRMMASASKPTFIQGPEPYPSEAVITHYANKAKNGAAAVTVTAAGSIRQDQNSRLMYFDYKSGACQHYICQLVDSIHYYGSLANVFLFPEWDGNYDVSTGIAQTYPVYDPGKPEFPREYISKMIQQYADQAAVMQELGFDMAYVHAAYRGMPAARFISPLTNKRTDDYGGSLENRARFLLEVCEAIRRKCGRDFLLEVCLSGEDPAGLGGMTLDETVELVKLGEGLFDIVQLRSGDIDTNIPTGYFKEHIPYAYMAEALKKGGVKTPVELASGCFYPQDCEDAIVSGKADFVTMARAWISNPDYGQLVYEGRDDDLIPCIRCNKCNHPTPGQMWISTCSVNPEWGIENRLDRLVAPVAGKKKIAVVGGGPAGMEAALVAAKRGHSVTLYEMSDKLGGQLKAGCVPSFKWPLKDYVDYMRHQVEKSGIKVLCNTKATAEMLSPENYDSVIAAVGAQPIIPPIPGSDGKNVITAVDVYGNEDKLAKDVVIIGGGEIGAETGMHLAELGHNVELIEMRDELAADAAHVHFYKIFIEYVNNTKGFNYTLEATCTGITENGVTYKDKDGVSHEIKAGSVVVAVGNKAKAGEAAALFNLGEKVLMCGDCVKAGSLQKAIRSAYAVANQL